MRLESLRIKGLGPFTNEVAIDLTCIGGKVVAVCGGNGAGKSTALELALPGAMYRSTPTRGSLANLATTRASFVEATLVNGRRWTIRQTVDQVSGKAESLVLDDAGSPVLPDAKVRSFDAWAAQHLPVPEVLFASTFAAQGTGGFLAAKPSDRKAILLRTLGIEHLETLAERGRERARAAKAKLDTLVARIGDEKARGLDVAEAEQALASARATAAQADIQLEKARAELARVQREAQAHQEHGRQRADLDERRQGLARTVETIAERMEALGAITCRADQIRSAVEQLAVLDRRLVDTRAQLATAEAEATAANRTLEGAIEGSVDADRAARTAVERVEAARAEMRDVEERIANNRGLLGRADQIRRATTRDAEIIAERQQIEAQNELIKRDLARAEQDAQQHERLRLAATTRKAEASKRAEAARARLADREAIDRAVADLERLRDTVGTAAQEALVAEEQLEALRGQRVAGADQRIESLRTTLGVIADGETDDPTQEAQKAITTDDEAVALSRELPTRLSEASKRRNTAASALENARQHLSAAERIAARAGEIEQAESALRSAEADIATCDAEAKSHRADAEAARAAITRLQPAYAALHNLDAERARLEPLVRLAPRLEQAEARIGELERQLAASRMRLEDADQERRQALTVAQSSASEASQASDILTAARARVEEARGAAQSVAAERESVAEVAALADDLARSEAALAELLLRREAANEELSQIVREIARLGAPCEAPGIAAAELVVRTAERVARDAHAAPPVREHALRQAQKSEAKVAELEAQRSAVESDLADWALLAADLGRDGLQAMEVDAAGPELTVLVNDLLRSCVGHRWTVSIETQRLSADGKKMLEGCDVRVIDTERGRDATAESLSGGERVLVGEAVSLALSMLATRRSAGERPTIIRDETGAALDTANGRAYVAMLRRAADMVGADKVLFVAHNPDLWELADARLLVHDGKVEVQ